MFAKQSRQVKKSFEEIFRPRPYQIKAIKWCISRPAAALFLKPGLGKTVIILAVYHMLRKRGLVKKMLVVSNRRIIYNVWRQEIEKWNLPYTVALVHGGYKSKRTGKTKKETALESEADIYLINFEAVPWLITKARNMAKFAGGMLVADESVKVKTWMSQRTQAFKKLLPLFKRRYILSANPRPRSMMDLFAQIYMLDMGKALGKGIMKFRNKYFYQYGDRDHGLYGLLEGAEDKIYKAISHLAIYFGEDELDLPPMVQVRRYVSLDTKTREIYNSLEQNMIAHLKSGAITAANAGVATGKLRQISGGSVYLPYKATKLDTKKPKRGKFEVLHREKIDEVLQIIDELKGRPVFISYEFDHERLALQKVLKEKGGDAAPAIFSDTTDASGTRFIAQWNRGKLNHLIGQSQSVSHGLNLQEIEAAVIYFSLTWDFDAFDQFRRRIWRQGQIHPVFVYYILCEDTIDETMFNVLKLKNASQERMFKALHERYINPHQKGLFKMATSKAKNRKKTTHKKAKPGARKKTAAKRAKIKRKPAAKRKRIVRKPAKLAPRKGLKKGQHNPTLNRTKDGLRKGSVQASIVEMARRKIGVTIAQLEAKHGTSPGSVRVNVSLLKGRGFKLTCEDGKYTLR